MSELSQDPVSIFTPENPNIKIEYINGYLVPTLELCDTHGSYLAIPALYPELSDICEQVISGYMITEIDYDTYNGKQAIIKAYYSHNR